MSASSVTEVTSATFEAEVLQADRLVLIDFYADWCGPCKTLAPVLEQFAAANPQVKVVKINVDTSPDLADAFKIRSIPSLVTMKDGQGLIGAVGNLPRRTIEKLVEQALQIAAANNINSKADPKGPKP